MDHKTITAERGRRAEDLRAAAIAALEQQTIAASVMLDLDSDQIVAAGPKAAILMLLNGDQSAITAPRFKDADELAAWLDGLHESDENGTVSNRKWEPAQRAAEAIRTPAATSGDAPTDLQQLKALALAATPGPWSSDRAMIAAVHPRGNDADGTTVLATFTGYFDEQQANAAFCAAASPAVVLGLIARIERAAAPADISAPRVADKGVYHWYIAYCEVSAKLKAADGCIERYARELEQARAASPATASGDELPKTWQARSVGPDHLGLYPDAFACMLAEVADLRAAVSAATKPAPLDLTKLEARLEEVGEIARAGATWNGNEWQFANKTSVDVGLIDDAISDALSITRSLLATKPAAAPTVPSQITDTTSARKFVDAWHRKHFPTDRTFSRYIMADPARSNPLAGDFAWQLAKALESLSASQPSKGGSNAD